MNIVLMLCLAAAAGSGPHETNPVKIVLGGAIAVYQKTLSGAQGDVCNFYPSCSNFSKQAFSRYGFFWGSLMTADRLMRCQPGAVGYFNRYYHGIKHSKLYDPVEQNFIFGRIEWHRFVDDLSAGHED